MKQNVEVGGPAIYEGFLDSLRELNGRVMVMEIDETYFAGEPGVRVKGDEPSNVGATWWAYAWELRALGG